MNSLHYINTQNVDTPSSNMALYKCLLRLQTTSCLKTLVNYLMSDYRPYNAIIRHLTVIQYPSLSYNAIIRHLTVIIVFTIL